MSTAAFASASALSVDGGTIQAGSSHVKCDTNGVKVNWGLETDDDSVRFVRVSKIDRDCKGATLFAKVNGGKTMSAEVDGTEVKLPFTAPFPTAKSVKDIKVWIEG